MNESSNAKTMYEAVPAVAELNKVPGFDPLKFLRTKDSMRLDLPYQKLWFRMAHPNGRTELGAVSVLARRYVNCYARDQYVSSPFYVYISKSKNGQQYLDSLGGAAMTSRKERYVEGAFLVERAALHTAGALPEKEE